MARRRFSTQDAIALMEEGLTRQEAARQLGVTAWAIALRFRSEGLEWRGAQHRLRFDDTTFARLWNCHAITTDEIAVAAGVTRQAVSARAHSMGLPSRNALRRRKMEPALFRDMWQAGVRLRDIARYFDYAHTACASAAARKLGLPRRQRGPSGHRNGGWVPTITLEQFLEARLAGRLRAEAADHDRRGRIQRVGA
ncbi:hypothetical protein [Roseinatronobacter sp.]